MGQGKDAPPVLDADSKKLEHRVDLAETAVHFAEGTALDLLMQNRGVANKYNVGIHTTDTNSQMTVTAGNQTRSESTVALQGEPKRTVDTNNATVTTDLDATMTIGAAGTVTSLHEKAVSPGSIDLKFGNGERMAIVTDASNPMTDDRPKAITIYDKSGQAIAVGDIAFTDVKPTTKGSTQANREQITLYTPDRKTLIGKADIVEESDPLRTDWQLKVSLNDPTQPVKRK